MTDLVILGDATARQRASDAMMGFLDAMVETFPECDKCIKAAEKFRTQGKGIEIMEDLACRQWLNALSTPLPASVAPYVFPLTRLMDTPPILYHALAYKDGDTLVMFGDIPLVSSLELDAKWHHPEFAEDRLIMLRYIEHITKCVLKYATIPALRGICGPGAPPVPTREAIEAEIARFAAEQRAALPAGGAISSGCAATMEAITTMFDMHTDGEAAPSTHQQLQTEWELLMADPNFAKLCDKNNEGAIRLLETTSIPSFANATQGYGRMPADARADVWQALNNLVSFTTLANAMPAAMRSKAEEVAAMLTGQIENHTMTAEDLTPQRMIEIGQSILETTTEEDMNAIASQMDTLLPAVQAMTRNNSMMQGLDRETGGLLSKMF
jgi:hypothetical protein